MMEQEVILTRAHLKAPRAGAIAGILFSILLITCLVLIRISVPAGPEDAGTWLSSSWKTVALALHLLPFAGIAFLWFIGVLRDQMAVYEDPFFATVFLGSAFLFLAMLFASAAMAGGIMMTYRAMPDELMRSATYTFARIAVYHLVNVYAVKMAGVFMITTCTLSIRTKILPRWMALLGYALALVLLLSIGYFNWTLLVLPLWVLLISIHILLMNLKLNPASRNMESINT